MIIQKNTVVSIEYTLRDDEGNVIDTSSGREPLLYIQGIGNLIPGMEEALEGKKTGDQFQVTISPEKGYGVFDETLIFQVNSSQFQSEEPLQVGMMFQGQTPKGMRVLTIAAIEGDFVTLDGNHQLAGQNLNFEVEVLELRPATREELDHGHVHGPGGHHH